MTDFYKTDGSGIEKLKQNALWPGDFRISVKWRECRERFKCLKTFGNQLKIPRILLIPTSLISLLLYHRLEFRNARFEFEEKLLELSVNDISNAMQQCKNGHNSEPLLCHLFSMNSSTVYLKNGCKNWTFNAVVCTGREQQKKISLKAILVTIPYTNNL